MSISYPLDFPSSPAPRDVEWLPDSSVSTSRSIFNFTPQTYDWGGQIRMVRIELPPMTLAQAKVWQAWLHKLNGPEGTFYFSDTLGKAGQGVSTGTPRVNGSGQVDEVLVTDGWGSGDSVVAGDWISIHDKLYTILENASETAGAMSLTVWPELDMPGDNESISYGVSARGIFRLSEFPNFAWNLGSFQNPIILVALEDTGSEALETQEDVPLTTQEDEVLTI